MHCTGQPTHSCIRYPTCCTRLAAALQSRRFQPTTPHPEWLRVSILMRQVSRGQCYKTSTAWHHYMSRTGTSHEYATTSDRRSMGRGDEQHVAQKIWQLLVDCGSCLEQSGSRSVSVVDLRSEGPTKDRKAPRAPTNQAVEASSRLAVSESSVQHLVRQNGASEPVWALQLQQDHL